jgi:hypothetical protein
LVSDTNLHQIRKVEMSTAADSLVAGGTSSGSTNGIASAFFSSPYGITISTDGSYALVADYSNHQIRKIVIATRVVTSLAGASSSGSTNGIGTSALFYHPTDVTLSSDGSIAIVVDLGNYMIRKIVMSTAEVSFVAGGTSGVSDGIGSSAQFSSINGITLFSDDRYALVADSIKHNLRKIVLSTGEVSLFAGSPVHASGNANGIGTNTKFNSPHGLCTSSDGSFVLVTDSNNHMIRRIELMASAPSVPPTQIPSVVQSVPPTLMPSMFPTFSPSMAPTLTPSGFPTTLQLADRTSFLPNETSTTASVSLAFSLLALLFVVCRLVVMRPQIRSSSASVKSFEGWWWIVYSISCAISMVVAVVAVVTYSDALSDESEVSPLSLSCPLPIPLSLSLPLSSPSVTDSF